MRVSIEDLKYRIAEACIVCLQRADEYRLANNYAAYTAKESLVAAEQYRDQLVRQYVAALPPLDEFQEGMAGSDPLDFAEDSPCK